MPEEYKFEPDYAEWWAKEDLTKEQLIWLIMGVNPDDMTKLRELEGKLNPSENEKDWKWAFDGIDGYLEKLPDGGFFLSKTFNDYNQLIDWKDDKKQFITDTYEFHLKINDTFLKYLEASGEFSKNQKLEDFKAHAKYQYNFSESYEHIKIEDNAFSILLGLEPEFLLRFFELDKINKTTPRDERDYVEYINFTPENKWFYSEYKKFLESLYGETAQYKIGEALKKAKELNVWNGNFPEYCQSLYDEGFIFKNDVYAGLEKLGIKLHYPQSAWAVKFYHHWNKKGGWTISEALSLFKGQNPDKQKHGFYDLSQNPLIIWEYEKQVWSYNLFMDDYEDLIELLSRHTAIENISKYEYANNDYLYKPKDIIEWLLEHTLHIPPKALLQVLEIYESQEIEEQRSAENQIAQLHTAIHIENRKKRPLKADLEELYKKAMPIYDTYFQEQKTEPTKIEIATLLKNTYNLPWKATSIERELSAHKLKLQYQEYKKDKAA